MSDTLETIARDAATGVVALLLRDDFADNDAPGAEDDFIIMAVLHRHYDNPAQAKGLTDQESIEAFEQKCAAGEEPYMAFPLFLFDHSGTTYKVGDPTPVGERPDNPFGDGLYAQFDSGRVGTLFVKIGEDGAADPAEAAKDHCQAYTQWANGDGYAYSIKDRHGETIESSGVYYDAEEAKQQALADFKVCVADAAKEMAEEAAAQARAAALIVARDDVISKARAVLTTIDSANPPLGAIALQAALNEFDALS